MRIRTEIYHARLNLPGRNARSISVDELDGIYIITAFVAPDVFVNETYHFFNRAWERVLELQEM